MPSPYKAADPVLPALPINRFIPLVASAAAVVEANRNEGAILLLLLLLLLLLPLKKKTNKEQALGVSYPSSSSAPAPRRG